MKPTQTSITNVIGEQFGPYKLVSRLGVGGMAETFVAIRSGPGGFSQRVCLKLVLPFFREDESFARLFEREAQLAAKLRHRNIVGVIDFGQIDGTAYMAMELVDGVDLRKLLDSSPAKRLAPEFVALLGLELAEALEHAHTPIGGTGLGVDLSDAPGIVHRDISPSNVLLSRRGEIFLTDFGVAKAMSGGSRKQSAVKGKVPYMAPEYLRGEELDGRSDLFSLGVVLFEALAGRRPYEGVHDPGTILQILKGEHESLFALAPEAPPDLCGVIESLIETDPEKRPCDAAAFIELLDPFATSRTSHRRLGRTVVKLREEIQPLAQESAGPPICGDTEILIDAPRETTGVNRTTNSPAPLVTGNVESKTEGLEDRGIAEIRTPPDAPDLPVASGGHGQAELASQPLVLMRPSKRRGLQPGDLDSIPVTPWHGRRADSQRMRAGRRSKKNMIVALSTLLGLATLVVLLITLWPVDDSMREPSESIEPSPGSLRRQELVTPAETRDESHLEPPTARAAEKTLSKNGAETTQIPAPEPTAESKTPNPDAGSPRPESLPQRRAKPVRDRGSVQRARATKPSPTSRQELAEAAPGRLSVTVIPFGDIWINGEPWGAAPLRNEPMKAGNYRISAGKGRPTNSRTVEVKAGERRQVEFDLRAP